MTVQEYISVFRMGQPNYEFNRVEFVKEFGKEFREEVNTLSKAFEDSGKKMPYLWFKDLVKTYNKKFNDISFAKPGKNLSKGLWNTFYKLHIVPLRSELFPESQKRIEDYIKEHQSTR